MTFATGKKRTTERRNGGGLLLVGLGWVGHDGLSVGWSHSWVITTVVDGRLIGALGGLLVWLAGWWVRIHGSRLVVFLVGWVIGCLLGCTASGTCLGERTEVGCATGQGAVPTGWAKPYRQESIFFFSTTFVLMHNIHMSVTRVYIVLECSPSMLVRSTHVLFLIKPCSHSREAQITEFVEIAGTPDYVIEP